jgi:hypothetical protein
MRTSWAKVYSLTLSLLGIAIQFALGNGKVAGDAKTGSICALSVELTLGRASLASIP